VLAGDVLATIEQPQPGPGVGDPTSNCCHQCNKAADCDGMQFLHNSSGSFCVLIANGSLVPNVNRTASTSNSRSGLGLQPNRRCWNRDPPPNLRQSGGWTDLSESFKPFCSEHECGCEAAETLALGWQPQAMCNSMSGHQKKGPKIVAGDLGRRLATTVPDDDDTGKALVGSGFGPWPPYPGYWQCKSAVAQTCGGWDSWKNKGNCFGCARGNMNPGKRGSSLSKERTNRTALPSQTNAAVHRQLPDAAELHDVADRRGLRRPVPDLRGGHRAALQARVLRAELHGE